MLPESLQTPTWLLVRETLHFSPDPSRLDAIVARKPDPDELFRISTAHGILPLVDRNLGPVRDALLNADTRECWRGAVAAATLAGLQMHRELQRLQRILADAGIPVVPLKGPALADRLYGDSALRVSADLDLLIPLEKLDAASALLKKEGWHPDFDPKRMASLTDTRVRWNHGTFTHNQRGWIVEVHWQLFITWLGRRSMPLTANDWLNADRSDNEELLLYLCLHGTKHWWRQLKWVVDIDRCVRLAHGLDWERLSRVAGARGCQRALDLGLWLACEFCGLQLPPPVADKVLCNRSVAALGRRVCSLWPEVCGGRPSYLFWQAPYFLACRDNWSDRVRMIVDYLQSRRGIA